ncbi:MAG: hypothetical protein KGI06_03430 [Candidatus Micrarchaeota archaeon]|nr:hypothetical protein [Candidatus Micrarchaeota archaeon]
MLLYLVRVISIVLIALAYMLFDLFNKRNVPSVFVYSTLAYGALLTILYLNARTIAISASISLVVLGVGYVVYRIGQLGAADVFEFAAISLMLPIQGMPFIASYAPQLSVPFIVSVAINAGIIALAIVPIYYIPKAISRLKKPITSLINKGNLLSASLLAIAYIVFIYFATLVISLNYFAIIMLAIMLTSSFLVMLFSVPVTYSMVREVTVKQMEEGDIIALNLMGERRVLALKKKIKGFGRLVTSDVMRQLKKAGVKDKMPVYKEAMPFALPIFVAVIFTLLFGNMIFIALGI